jgi:DNA-binding transcriptional LysR family regulator
MQTRQLQYFLAVADHGGFARAAEALRIAQPSLSQAIATFERELGTPLFHRVGRGVVLSSSGQDLVGPARAVMRSLEHAESSVGARARAGWDHLDVISTPTPGVEPLTAFLAAFTRERPRTKLNIAVGFTPAAVVEAVRSGEREIGVLGSPTPRAVRGLRSVALAPQPFVVISPPGEATGGAAGEAAGEMPGTAGPPPSISLADLRGARLIVPQRGSLIRATIDGLIESGSLDAEIVAEVSLRASIVPMVLSGIGRAVLASGWTELARQAGAVVQTITPELAIHISVVSRERDLTPAADAFMSLVAATGGSASRLT